MGVFDIELDEELPRFLLLADQDDSLVLVTSAARAFRLPVNQILETEVRARGNPILQDLTLRPDEEIAVVFADTGGAHLVAAQYARAGTSYSRSLFWQKSARGNRAVRSQEW